LCCRRFDHLLKYRENGQIALDRRSSLRTLRGMPDSSSANATYESHDRVPQHHGEPRPLADARALAAGVHELMGLLAATCGGSLRDAAELLGRDARTFARKHEMPSLTLIADLARALRMEVASAVAVVAHSRRVDHCRKPLLSSLADADLADDHTLLDELAESVRAESSCPLVMEVAQAACARAAQLRGDFSTALQLLRRIARENDAFDERIHREEKAQYQAILATLGSTVACELCVHCMLVADHEGARVAHAFAVRWLRFAQTNTHGIADASNHIALDLRREAQVQTMEVLGVLIDQQSQDAQPTVASVRVASAMYALDALLDRCELLDQALTSAAFARIATASMAGESACCALFALGDEGNMARVAIRLVVRASFMLDEAVELHCAESTLDAASRLACARRARLAEREELVRTRCDTKIESLKEITNFTQTLCCSLDALSSRDQMQRHVPCLRSGVAFADSRSESRC
jgi:hypothetical protein